MTQRGHHARRALREIDQFDAAFDRDAVIGEMLGEQAFGLRLIEKEQIRIPRLQGIEIEPREPLAVEIEIGDARAMPEIEKRLHDAMLFEEFERARLNADGA